MMPTYYPSLSNEKGNLQGQCPGDQKLSSFHKLPSHASTDGSYLELLSGSSMSSFSCAEFPSVGARSELAFILPTSDAISSQSIDGQLNRKADNLVGNSVGGDPLLVSRLLGLQDGKQILQPQGLSLSLGTQVQSALPLPSIQYQYPDMVFPSILGTHIPMLGKQTLSSESYEHNQGKEMRNSEYLSGFDRGNHDSFKREASHNLQHFENLKDTHADEYMYGPSGFASTSLNSKYSKAVQQLLDEVVNVRAALNKPASSKCLDESKETEGGSNSQSTLPTPSRVPSDPSDSTSKSSSELSPAELQDLQNKKTKLLSMLDEVDGKYKQYYHQMQIMVSSFDMVAGHGAAKSYTALALLTISRHFRCLRDAISGQIEVTKKRLGEQDGLGVIPRLRYVDRQVRQQRALQQLGVMRHSWRPQRGLPESSVSVLRAWLFEHFLHPYPNESEKLVLARQTGLTRSQVANWFINARVRLWKPMVEDIYKEEFGESETNSKSSLEDATKAHGENHLPLEKRLEELQDSLTSTPADSSDPGKVDESKSSHGTNLEMKKPITKIQLQNGSHVHNITSSRIMNFQNEERPGRDVHNVYQDENTPCYPNGDGSLMSAAVTYDMSDCGFGVGNEVSLALGLQHHESDAFPMFMQQHLL